MVRTLDLQFVIEGFESHLNSIVFNFFVSIFLKTAFFIAR
jgi:hypothetical protein